jgi:urease accessory protein
MRPGSPYVFTNLKKGQGLDDIVAFIVDRGMLAA